MLLFKLMFKRHPYVAPIRRDKSFVE